VRYFFADCSLIRLLEQPYRIVCLQFLTNERAQRSRRCGTTAHWRQGPVTPVSVRQDRRGCCCCCCDCNLIMMDRASSPCRRYRRTWYPCLRQCGPGTSSATGRAGPDPACDTNHAGTHTYTPRTTGAIRETTTEFIPA